MKGKERKGKEGERKGKEMIEKERKVKGKKKKKGKESYCNSVLGEY